MPEKGNTSSALCHFTAGKNHYTSKQGKQNLSLVTDSFLKAII
jgi:hypothetical protein